MGYDKWYLYLLFAQCEDIFEFEIQNHVDYIYI